MKTYGKVLGVVAGVLLACAPAFAAGEVGMGPGATLADFQNIYAGTKPVVAWAKYHEYQFLQGVPKPTLGTGRMRIEGAVADEEGTKPVVAFLKPHKAELGVHLVRKDGAAGTKPVVAFLRR